MDFIFIKSSKAGKEDFGSVYARVRTGKANVKTVTGWKIQCKLPPKTKRFCPLVLK